MNRPYVLTVAGHDPSGGAGLNADTKSFEQNLVQGLSVCSALTVQDESIFKAVHWTDQPLVLNQLNTLLDRYPIKYAKIGLIQSFDSLYKILITLNQSDVKVIWDPILNSSSGFNFHNKTEEIKEIIRLCYLVTPNREEIVTLSKESNPEKGAKKLSIYTNVLLKGGHAKNHANDLIFTKGKLVQEFFGEKLKGFSKHGTGCVLSAVITANLALGYSMADACSEAKKYVERFIISNNSRLGNHFDI